MDEINPENAILANLVFGIGNIKTQMKAIEVMMKETALKSQKLLPGGDTLQTRNVRQGIRGHGAERRCLE